MPLSRQVIFCPINNLSRWMPCYHQMQLDIHSPLVNYVVHNWSLIQVVSTCIINSLQFSILQMTNIISSVTTSNTTPFCFPIQERTCHPHYYLQFPSKSTQITHNRCSSNWRALSTTLKIMFLLSTHMTLHPHSNNNLRPCANQFVPQRMRADGCLTLIVTCHPHSSCILCSP